MGRGRDSPGSSGARLVLAPTWIAGVSPEDLPARVRVGVGEDGDQLYGPGAALRTRALLNRPPPPAAPGAYDFARDSYFRRIGGVGAALTAVEGVSLRPPDAPTRLAIAVNAFRWSLSRRIIDRMGPEQGGVAVAMVTGHEAWVSPETTQAMRDSGLAHVLSISGLHMTIVGGFVFFAVRAGAAAWPWLALRVSTKKLAAGAGLVAVLAYLILSGAPPPAVRAAVTASVASSPSCAVAERSRCARSRSRR
jgi:competence protein ComEC